MCARQFLFKEAPDFDIPDELYTQARQLQKAGGSRPFFMKLAAKMVIFQFTDYIKRSEKFPRITQFIVDNGLDKISLDLNENTLIDEIFKKIQNEEKLFGKKEQKPPENQDEKEDLDYAATVNKSVRNLTIPTPDSLQKKSSFGRSASIFCRMKSKVIPSTSTLSK